MNVKQKILIADDSEINRALLMEILGDGYEYLEAENGVRAVELLREHTDIALVLLDIMMPQMDGFEFAQKIREVNKHIPILFMSAKDDLPSKQKGFRLGIDDYMVKPVELAELEMRVRALLRRANIEMERRLTVGNLGLDADAVTAEVDGEEVPVAAREFNILYKLLSYPKKTFTRAQLMDEFWGLESETSLRAVDVYITKLRDKFSGCDSFEIKTVRGIGYKAVLL